MNNRRALSFLGVLLGISSLAWGQDNRRTPPPRSSAGAASGGCAAPTETPPNIDQGLPEEPVSQLHELFVLYNGESTLSSQVEMGGWGSIETDPKFNPFIPQHLAHTAYALYISTQGRYQGVRFDFPQPLPAAQLLRAKNVYLEPVPAHVAEQRVSLHDRSPTCYHCIDELATSTASHGRGKRGGRVGRPGHRWVDAMGDNAATLSPASRARRCSTGQRVPEEYAAQAPDRADARTDQLALYFLYRKRNGSVYGARGRVLPKEVIKRQWIRIGIPLSTVDPASPLARSSRAW